MRVTARPSPIAPGTTTVSFTNQAYGQLEICKHIAAVAGDPDYPGTVFRFSIDGGTTPIDVAAGACSLPQTVSAGSHTIQEVNLPYGFAFSSATATGPLGQNRLTAAGNPMTVTVPYLGASDGGETQLDVYDTVLRARVKICKNIAPGSEASIDSLIYRFEINGRQVPGAVVEPPYPGCTGLLYDTPIVDANGNPVTITVTELPGRGFQVSGATVDHVAPGTTPSVTTGSGGGITFTPAAGTSVVTITNTFTPCTPFAYVTEYSNEPGLQPAPDRHQHRPRAGRDPRRLQPVWHRDDAGRQDSGDHEPGSVRRQRQQHDHFHRPLDRLAVHRSRRAPSSATRSESRSRRTARRRTW